MAVTPNGGHSAARLKRGIRSGSRCRVCGLLATPAAERASHATRLQVFPPRSVLRTAEAGDRRRVRRARRTTLPVSRAMSVPAEPASAALRPGQQHEMLGLCRGQQKAIEGIPASKWNLGGGDGVDIGDGEKGGTGILNLITEDLRVCEKIYCARDLAFRRCSESSCISTYTPVPALRRNATSLRSRRFFHKL